MRQRIDTAPRSEASGPSRSRSQAYAAVGARTSGSARHMADRVVIGIAHLPQLGDPPACEHTRTGVVAVHVGKAAADFQPQIKRHGR